MKKTLIVFCGMVALLCLTNINAQAQNRANQAIAKVRQECGNLYHGQHNGQNVSWQISNIALGICSNPGGIFEVYEVSVFFICKARPGTACRPEPPIVIGSVTYDCEGGVTVRCN